MPLLIRYTIIIILIAVSLWGVTNYYASTKERLPQYGVLPDFELYEVSTEKFNTGKFNQTNLQDQVWLVHTFFSNCPGVCPTLIGDIKEVLNLVDHPEKLAVLSVTIDPQRDTLPTLRRYYQKHKLSGLNWRMLTGSQEALNPLTEQGLKLHYPKDPNEHSPRVVLIDQARTVRGFYSIDTPNGKKELAQAIQTLLH